VLNEELHNGSLDSLDDWADNPGVPKKYPHRS
jgi:hypothetical protein